MNVMIIGVCLKFLKPGFAQVGHRMGHRIHADDNSVRKKNMAHHGPSTTSYAPLEYKYV